MTAIVTTNIDEAAAFLQAGKLVAFGTETVYGLGANALDAEAVAKIFEAKQRPSFDPLIVHLPGIDDVKKYAAAIPPSAVNLMDTFWPGPLTIVLPKRSIIPDLVTSGLPSVGLRVPASAKARELISKAGVPVAAPSANRFGCVSPTTAQHVVDGLGDAIDAVLDCGPCGIGVESTVITFDENEQVILLRPGGVTVEQLETVVDQVTVLQPSTNDNENRFLSPGMLTKHYAPSKQLEIVDSFVNVADGAEVGVLSLGPVANSEWFSTVEVLSSERNLTEAATNFFAALRRLEQAPIQRIVAMPFPDDGLGRALNDRLRRAAAK